MPFSSGTFTLYSPGNPVVTGTTIASTWANNTLNDIATGLTACLLKDGTQVVTADIPMASFALTGLRAGAAAGESLRYEQLFLAGAALTATGTGQSDALQLAEIVNQVTTTASGTGVKLLAAPAAGQFQIVYNGGANPLRVYPQTSGTINQLSANSGHILPVATTCMYWAVTTSAWVALLSY